ncbi:mechanosensitive ion channel family protein [Corynebacterium liangguodongii]|uniref:Mechanosensitive ion channel protein MscS n=1 Tax=Corynebacterium liangguodongii TaxID=2079535 RepID=A0A2S0WFK0_9CORY|nr:mechanosensitive ion channel family protein [Corynebacterium liangguodongii]AWB84548.1 mechanosensitive ion channel protein MscS [Corynebacterium liangguodongii]PWB98868.1 mechanosensitive ion channel family protein [Corynebacterium liangguodongii]
MLYALSSPSDHFVAAAGPLDALSSWWNTPEVRENLLVRPIMVVLIITIAVAVHFVASRLIGRAATRSINHPGGTLGLRRVATRKDSPQARAQEARRQARIRTLSNVGRSAAAVVIWSWAALWILDELGVNVAPLIASAGIVGVALGFGAQALVRDFISGIFMLIENQYGVGDTISVNGVEGTVEDMSLRVTTLRDIDGVLWYIRNGDISQVGNESDTYSVARLEVPVSLAADPKRAAEVISTSAQRAAADPAIAESVISEPVVLGVSTFATDHMTYRVTLRTMPGEQWGVARFMYEDILKALQDAGITLPGTQPLLITNKLQTPPSTT